MTIRYWIVTISEDNLGLSIKNKMIGLPRKREYYIRLLQDSDKVIFYIGKKRVGYGGIYPTVREFGPIAEINSDAFYDDKILWHSRTEETYPWRRKIRIILKKRVKVRRILSQLSFIHNQQRWGLYFIKGVREISISDYNIIKNALQKQEPF